MFSIETVRSLFQSGNRVGAWEEALRLLPPGDPFRYRAKRFLRTAAYFDRIRASLYQPAIIPFPVLSNLVYEPLPAPRGRKRLIPGQRPWNIQRKRAIRSWAGIQWADRAERLRRMEPCHRARRRAKDQRLLGTVHPRIRKLLGDETLLKQLGRTP